MDGVERRGLAVDGTRSNRPTSQMVGSAEGPVSSVVRKLEGERGKRKCERRYTSTPRLFSLLLFPFPSSSSLSSLLSIWVRPVHSPHAMYVMPWQNMYVASCHVLLGLWEILGLYFGHRAPKIQANTGSTEGEIHAYFGAQSTRRLVMHYIVK